MSSEPTNGRSFHWMPFVVAGSLLVVVALAFALVWQPPARTPPPDLEAADAKAKAESKSKQLPTLMIYCAASQKAPIEAITKDYEAAYGTKVQLQFGASQSLLTNAEVSQQGDIFLPADESYIAVAQKKLLVRETIPLATMQVVLVVKKGNPLGIKTFADLLDKEVKISLANPDAAAIGKLCRTALTERGHWDVLAAKVKVFTGTVNDTANNLKVGSVDAGIIWDAMLPQYPDLESVPLPELAHIDARVTLGVLACSKRPSEALRLARYIAASDRGLVEYAKRGYKVLPGDAWEEQPELTLYAGALLRTAIEDTITKFEIRESVQVTRVYNGCGILVGQIKAGKVPDAYFACDKQFIAMVQEQFPEPKVVSSNRLVILVPKGNPKHIATLSDLGQPGLRVGVGHEQQCALGQLTAETFRRSGVSERVSENIKVRVPAGDMLVNQMRAGALDAAVAYLANAVNAGDALDAVAIPNLPCAVAIQPYAVAKNAKHAQLAARLYEAIVSADSKQRFVANGFGWGEPPAEERKEPQESK